MSNQDLLRHAQTFENYLKSLDDDLVGIKNAFEKNMQMIDKRLRKLEGKINEEEPTGWMPFIQKHAITAMLIIALFALVWLAVIAIKANNTCEAYDGELVNSFLCVKKEYPAVCAGQEVRNPYVLTKNISLNFTGDAK